MMVSSHLTLSPWGLSVNGSSASFSGVRQSLWVTVLGVPLACFCCAASNWARWAGVNLAAISGGRPMLPVTLLVIVPCQRPVFTFSLIFPPATRAEEHRSTTAKAIIFLILFPSQFVNCQFVKSYSSLLSHLAAWSLGLIRNLKCPNGIKHQAIALRARYVATR